MTSILTFLQQQFTVYQTPPFPEGSLVATIEGQSVAIDVSDLTEREIGLLKVTLPEPKHHHPWAKALLEGGPMPTSGTVCFTHLSIEGLETEQQALFADTMLSFFDASTTSFYRDATHLVLVAPNPSDEAVSDLLTDVLSTLDTDFDTRTRAYLGRTWPVDSQLSARFLEEQQLANFSHEPLSSLETAALGFYTQHARHTSSLLQALAALINEADADMRSVITALYHHQGNLTATAKALFLHRNTLQYRLDKFQSQTGFSLKRMDDLVLCYLLIQH